MGGPGGGSLFCGGVPFYARCCGAGDASSDLLAAEEPEPGTGTTLRSPEELSPFDEVDELQSGLVDGRGSADAPAAPPALPATGAKPAGRASIMPMPGRKHKSAESLPALVSPDHAVAHRKQKRSQPRYSPDAFDDDDENSSSSSADDSSLSAADFSARISAEFSKALDEAARNKTMIKKHPSMMRERTDDSFMDLVLSGAGSGAAADASDLGRGKGAAEPGTEAIAMEDADAAHTTAVVTATKKTRGTEVGLVFTSCREDAKKRDRRPSMGANDRVVETIVSCVLPDSIFRFRGGGDAEEDGAGSSRSPLKGATVLAVNDVPVRNPRHAAELVFHAAGTLRLTVRVKSSAGRKLKEIERLKEERRTLREKLARTTAKAAANGNGKGGKGADDDPGIQVYDSDDDEGEEDYFVGGGSQPIVAPDDARDSMLDAKADAKPSAKPEAESGVQAPRGTGGREDAEGDADDARSTSAWSCADVVESAFPELVEPKPSTDDGRAPKVGAKPSPGKRTTSTTTPKKGAKHRSGRAQGSEAPGRVPPAASFSAPVGDAASATSGGSGGTPPDASDESLGRMHSRIPLLAAKKTTSHTRRMKKTIATPIVEDAEEEDGGGGAEGDGGRTFEEFAEDLAAAAGGPKDDAEAAAEAEEAEDRGRPSGSKRGGALLSRMRLRRAFGRKKAARDDDDADEDDADADVAPSFDEAVAPASAEDVLSDLKTSEEGSAEDEEKKATDDRGDVAAAAAAPKRDGDDDAVPATAAERVYLASKESSQAKRAASDDDAAQLFSSSIGDHLASPFSVVADIERAASYVIESIVSNLSHGYDDSEWAEKAAADEEVAPFPKEEDDDEAKEEEKDQKEGENVAARDEEEEYEDEVEELGTEAVHTEEEASPEPTKVKKRRFFPRGFKKKKARKALEEEGDEERAPASKEKEEKEKQHVKDVLAESALPKEEDAGADDEGDKKNRKASDEDSGGNAEGEDGEHGQEDEVELEMEASRVEDDAPPEGAKVKKGRFVPRGFKKKKVRKALEGTRDEDGAPFSKDTKNEKEEEKEKKEKDGDTEIPKEAIPAQEAADDGAVLPLPREEDENGDERLGEYSDQDADGDAKGEDSEEDKVELGIEDVRAREEDSSPDQTKVKKGRFFDRGFKKKKAKNVSEGGADEDPAPVSERTKDEAKEKEIEKEMEAGKEKLEEAADDATNDNTSSTEGDPVLGSDSADENKASENSEDVPSNQNADTDGPPVVEASAPKKKFLSMRLKKPKRSQESRDTLEADFAGKGNVAAPPDVSTDEFCSAEGGKIAESADANSDQSKQDVARSEAEDNDRNEGDELTGNALRLSDESSGIKAERKGILKRFRRSKRPSATKQHGSEGEKKVGEVKPEAINMEGQASVGDGERRGVASEEAEHTEDIHPEEEYDVDVNVTLSGDVEVYTPSKRGIFECGLSPIPSQTAKPGTIPPPLRALDDAVDMARKGSGNDATSSTTDESGASLGANDGRSDDGSDEGWKELFGLEKLFGSKDHRSFEAAAVTPASTHASKPGGSSLPPVPPAPAKIGDSFDVSLLFGLEDVQPPSPGSSILGSIPIDDCWEGSPSVPMQMRDGPNPDESLSFECCLQDKSAVNVCMEVGVPETEDSREHKGVDSGGLHAPRPVNRKLSFSAANDDFNVSLCKAAFQSRAIEDVTTVLWDDSFDMTTPNGLDEIHLANAKQHALGIAKQTRRESKSKDISRSLSNSRRKLSYRVGSLDSLKKNLFAKPEANTKGDIHMDAINEEDELEGKEENDVTLLTAEMTNEVSMLEL